MTSSPNTHGRAVSNLTLPRTENAVNRLVTLPQGIKKRVAM